MLDARLRRLFGPQLDRVGRLLARRGVYADTITLGGFALGVAAMLAVAAEAYSTGLALLALNRLADGLDGAVARSSKLTDLGGLAEGTETVLFLGLACLLPEKFTPLALVFGSLCWLTTLGRVMAGYQLLREPRD